MHARPLLHKRIAITRAAEQGRELVARLRVLGAEPIICPAIAFAPPEDFGPLDAALAALDSYDWLILTSANGVEALIARAAALHADLAPLAGKRIGAVGPATAAALERHGLPATFVPSAYVAEALLDEIGDVRGQRVLLPRADIARPELPAGLRERGATVDDIVAYRTVPGEGAGLLAGLLRAGSLDAVTFSSASAVRYTLDALQSEGIPRPEAAALISQVAVACIGPITADAARAEGLRVAAVAAEHTYAGLVEALVALYSPT